MRLARVPRERLRRTEPPSMGVLVPGRALSAPLQSREGRTEAQATGQPEQGPPDGLHGGVGVPPGPFYLRSTVGGSYEI